MSDERKVVGWKSMVGGGRLPLYEDEAKEIQDRWEAAEAKRHADMPTEQDAINAMFNAWLRLKDFGWREAIYCPKDGSTFKVIEAGSTGIHDCSYMGEWPDGTWWIHDDGDMCPSRPILYKKSG